MSHRKKLIEVAPPLDAIGKMATQTPSVRKLGAGRHSASR
jgi:hypothetical protein